MEERRRAPGIKEENEVTITATSGDSNLPEEEINDNHHIAPHSRFKTAFFPAFAVFIGLVVALLFSEAALRILHIQPERYDQPRWLAWDGVMFREGNIWGGGLIKQDSRFADAGIVMGEYVPGARFKEVLDSNPRGYFDRDNSVLMTVNSLGLRGEEVSASKTDGTYRILGIGDSFTFGVGVKDGDTFLNRLQLQLNAESSGHVRFQVLNAGVQGYNTRDEIVYLANHWLALKPDLVLIVFYINDAYSDETILNRGEELGIYDPEPSGLARYSSLVDLVQYRYKAYWQSKAVETYYKSHYFTEARQVLERPGQNEMDWPGCREALEHAARICRQRNVKLGLVIFPQLYKLNDAYPFLQIHQLVGDTCRRIGIPVLDLLDTFHGHNPETLWVHPSDHHPNEIAHALAAKSIESFVRTEFLKSGEP
jgi:hypothetical protein